MNVSGDFAFLPFNWCLNDLLSYFVAQKLLDLRGAPGIRLYSNRLGGLTDNDWLDAARALDP